MAKEGSIAMKIDEFLGWGQGTEKVLADGEVV